MRTSVAPAAYKGLGSIILLILNIHVSVMNSVDHDWAYQQFDIAHDKIKSIAHLALFPLVMCLLLMPTANPMEGLVLI